MLGDLGQVTSIMAEVAALTAWGAGRVVGGQLEQLAGQHPGGPSNVSHHYLSVLLLF